MSSKISEDDLTEEQAVKLIRKHRQALRLIAIATTLDYGNYHADGDCLEGAEESAARVLETLGIKRAADIANEDEEEDQ